jgi:GrpB-like predicted nucleotidyltransferase (UPF0157 family)
LDEKIRLKKIIFPCSKVEHIGSTSVKGLGGKGIIDIMISAPKDKTEVYLRELEKLGYEHKPLGGDKDRKFFQRIIKHNQKERRIHIHLTKEKSKSWNSAIKIRDYLRENPLALKEYEKIKKEAVKYAKGDGEKYREYKDGFLKNML